MKLIRKMIYDGDKTNQFTKYIYYRAFQTVLRGFFYKVFYLHAKGVISIASNVKILGTKKNVCFGSLCKIEENVVLQSISNNKMIFGNNVTICFGALIRPSGHWGGALGYGLKIGNGSSIGAYSYIGCSGQIEIGDNVLIGPRVTIIAENHDFQDKNLLICEQGVTNKGIRIENNVWIGANVTILDGVTIESGAVIAAGAVVTKRISKDAVVAGIPAKILRYR